MDTIEERIAAAKTSKNSFNKLTHLNSALDLIILKIAVDEGIIDGESGYSVSNAISDDRFPSENREVYVNLEKRISSGLHGRGVIKSAKKVNDDKKFEMLKNIDEVHKNVDELITEIEALHESIQD